MNRHYSSRDVLRKYGVDGRTYNLLATIDSDPYPEEGRSTHKSKGWRKKLWKRKVLMTYEYRAFRTWKHNRKTQYK